MTDWILIETNYSSNCVQCNEQINKGDTAYWKKGTGLKCYHQCTNDTTPEEDKTQLIIQEQDEDFYLK